jgi:hypothetical protein
MNVLDILKYGHLTFTGTLEGVPQAEWETGGVCGVWSVKNIIAHLTSYELVVADVLRSFVNDEPTPHLETMGTLGPAEFNDSEVAKRQAKSAADTLAEYQAAHAQIRTLAAQIPAETFRQNGTIPWYGEGYDLEDFIVYINYAHKREHSAEINVFRDRLAR